MLHSSCHFVMAQLIEQALQQLDGLLSEVEIKSMGVSGRDPIRPRALIENEPAAVYVADPELLKTMIARILLLSCKGEESKSWVTKHKILHCSETIFKDSLLCLKTLVFGPAQGAAARGLALQLPKARHPPLPAPSSVQYLTQRSPSKLQVLVLIS